MSSDRIFDARVGDRALRSPGAKHLERGFSLLEVLIAVLVIAIGLLSLAQLHGSLLHDSGVSKARTVALYLAQEKIEDLRSLETLRSAAGKQAFADIADDTGGGIAADASTGDGNTVYSATDYARRWTVVDYCFTGVNATAVSCSPASPNIPDLKQVSVTVSWQDRDGNTQSITLNTLIAAADPRQATPFASGY
jgi:type IV pilus modification protein PilV